MKRLSRWAYEQILKLYPQQMQREFGAELLEVFLSSTSDHHTSTARVWAREILALPANLIEAWSTEPELEPAGRLGQIRRRIPDWSLPYLVILSFVALAIGTAHLIADAGLFHYGTIILAVVVILLGGAATGLGSRITSPSRCARLLLTTIVLTGVALSATLMLDRVLVMRAEPGTESSIALPGLDLAFTATDQPSLPVKGDARRLRVVTFGSEDLRTLAVRSFFPDWLWTAAVMTLMLASASAARGLGRLEEI